MTPISRWIPEFGNRLVAMETPPHDRLRGAFPPMNIEPARRDIMIMDLMTMTSGLPAIGKLPAAYYPQCLSVPPRAPDSCPATH